MIIAVPAALFFLVSFVDAALVPCSVGSKCRACDLVTLGQNIMQFIIVIAVFLAAVLFAWAGILMVTSAGDTGQVAKAKGMFSSIIIGILIALAGWLIIDTIMKVLYNEGKSSFGPWNKIQCISQTPIATRSNPTGYYQNPNVGVPGAGPTSGRCAASNLSSWGSNAAAASCVCAAESANGVLDGTQSMRTDRMLLQANQPGFSFCPFQINMTTTQTSVNYNGQQTDCRTSLCNTRTQSCNGQGPDPAKCSAAIAQYRARNPNLPPLNANGGYCHVVVNERLYNQCVVNLLRPETCANSAQSLFNNGGWGHWRASAKKCHLI